jgi:phage-related minor tail protein
MTEISEIEDFSEGVDALRHAMDGATGMAAGFGNELKQINQNFANASEGMSKLGRSLSSDVSKAIDGVVLDGMKLSDALKIVANSMIDAAYRAAVKPVSEHIGGALARGMESLFTPFEGFADGGSFSQGRVMPFAKGGVISGPTTFPMRGGMGLMGEAGPEAIMPLTRGPDGSLGVRAAGGAAQPVQIVMNIQTPDAQSFQRSQSQIAASMGRALSMGARNR